MQPERSNVAKMEYANVLNDGVAIASGISLEK